MRILIAEDERITRLTLSRQLAAWGHDVTEAEDGQSAWEKYDAASTGFDLVITDWEMPRFSGIDLVRRIRAVPKPAGYTYLILLTSRSDKTDVVQGIEAGADDFVSKPFDRDELRVRLLAGQRIVNLERALNLQNAELRSANDRIRHGLLAAARVQQSMLPKGNISTPRVSAAWKYVPTDELAGDAIGLHLIDDRFLVAYVLDVSGHGVPAALLSVSAMHSLAPTPADASLLRGPPGFSGLGTVQRPARVAADLNRHFRAGENDGRYLTAAFSVLDLQTGQLHLACAGHPPPILLRSGQPVPIPDVGGFPVAIVDDAEYEECALQLQPGDRLCLFSDGVIEQMRPGDEELFGAPRLVESLRSRDGTPDAQLLQHIVDDLAAWAGKPQFADDVSLVSIRWTP